MRNERERNMILHLRLILRQLKQRNIKIEGKNNHNHGHNDYDDEYDDKQSVFKKNVFKTLRP